MSETYNRESQSDEVVRSEIIVMNPQEQSRAPIKVYLVNDTSSQNNWGCRATSAALHDLITDNNCEIIGVLSLDVMIRPPGLVRGILSSVKMAGATATRRWLRDTKSGLFRGFLRRLREVSRHVDGITDSIPSTISELEAYSASSLSESFGSDALRGIESCDIVVINGEGSLYGTQRKGRCLLTIAWVAKQQLGKAVVLVNHTADYADSSLRLMAASVLKSLDDVVYREPESADRWRQLSPQVVDPIGSDAAFLLTPAREWDPGVLCTGMASSVHCRNVSKFDASKRYICIGGSSAFLHGSLQQYDAHSALLKLCARLREAFDQIVLVASGHEDEEFLGQIATELDIPLFLASLPVSDGLNLLARAELYISGRWHSSIFAMLGGTPVIMFSANTYKSKGLLRMLGLNEEPFDAGQLHLSVEPIVQLSMRLVEEGESRRSSVLRCASEQAELAKKNGRFLVDFGRQRSQPIVPIR